MRQRFINYFKKHNHKYLTPLSIFSNENNSLFVNTSEHKLDEKQQYVNYQICIRVEGKYNDLDDVGFDNRHLSLFEMLSNWSNTKENSIKLSYDFLINECKLNPEQIFVTYFEGNNFIPSDDETKKIWKKYLPESHIIPRSDEFNFGMTNNNLYGPCTEIYYDIIGNRLISQLDLDSNNVIELWNNVFIEYKKSENNYQKLDKTFVHTGMGLERLTMIIQNKSSVYQTDIFYYLFSYAQILSNSEFYQDTYDNCMRNIAYRKFVDHIRIVVIGLYSGIRFNDTISGSIIRKIFRRLLSYFYMYLNRFVVTNIFENKSNLTKNMIDDILKYFRKKEYSIDNIYSQLIQEEQLYIIKLKSDKKEIDNHLINVHRSKLKFK